MPRKPGIWWKASHGCHYKTINGRQVRLHVNFERSVIMAAAYETSHAIPAPHALTVPHLVARYLEHAGRRVRPTTLAVARWALEGFARHAGAIAASEVRPSTVLDWLDLQGWSQSSRATYGGWVRIMMLWAADREIVPGYRLARLKLGSVERRAPITEEQARAAARGGRTTGDRRRLYR